MSTPRPLSIRSAWTALSRAQQVRLLSRQPLALVCTLQGGRRWRAVNGVLLDGEMRAALDSDEQYLGHLTIAIKREGATRTGRVWSMETHRPDDAGLNLVFDLAHEGTAAYLRWVQEVE